MPYVPERSQDIVGGIALRDAMQFNTHENYPVDGIDLNKLSCLAARLSHDEPLDAVEQGIWAQIIREACDDAKKLGAIDY